MDPWQLEKFHPPRALNPEKRCRLIWFGNTKNIRYLLNVINSIMGQSPKHINFLLTVLGRREALDMTFIHLKKIQANYPNWRLRLIKWNDREPIRQLEKELSKSHISIIPSDPYDPLKCGVSHNRLVDSIRGGCISIASPMDSYKELSDLAILGEDLEACSMKL